jgi:hypothetical protein
VLPFFIFQFTPTQAPSHQGGGKYYGNNLFGKKNIPLRCPECNILPGGFHHIGCGIEICPKCDRRWINCRCFGIKIKLKEIKGKVIPFKKIN